MRWYKTHYRITTLQGLLMIFTITVTSLAATVAFVDKPQQVRHQLLHSDQIEFCDTGGWIFPVKITSIEGDMIYYSVAGRGTVALRSVAIDVDTKLQDDVLHHYNTGLWVIIYCKQHQMAYEIFRYKLNVLPPATR